jgi:hypothetical protein
MWHEAVSFERYVHYVGWASWRYDKWHFRLFTPLRAHYAAAEEWQERQAVLQLERALETRDVDCLAHYVRDNAVREKYGHPLRLGGTKVAEAEQVLREVYHEAQQRFAAMPKHRGVQPEGVEAIHAMLAYFAENYTEQGVDVIFRDIKGADAVEGASLAWEDGFERREARSYVVGGMRARLTYLFPGLIDEGPGVSGAWWSVHTEVLRSEQDVVIIRKGSKPGERDRPVATIPTFDVRFRHTLVVPDAPRYTFESIVRPDPDYEWKSLSSTQFESERFTYYMEMMARAHYRLLYEMQIAYGLVSPESEKKKSAEELADEFLERSMGRESTGAEECPVNNWPTTAGAR